MAENNETLITEDTRLLKIDCVLTDFEKEIYHHLESNGPQTALSIAKAVKKKTTSEVNPHLYKMKAMNLLEQNSKVWSIKAVATTGVEGPAKNGSMSGTEVASKKIELTEQQENIITFLTSNEPSKARNIAKGIGKKVAKDVNRDLYKMKELNLLCMDNKEKLWSINTGSQMMSTPQNVIRHYNINLYGCHSFTVGDTTLRTTQGENSTIYHEYRDTDIATQEELNHESAVSHSEQSTDDSLRESIILHTSEDEAPCTSSPGHSSYHEPTLNISAICDGLGNVTLDDQDNYGDMNQLACTGEATFL
ncbi:Z-DNA-binding protein 1 isoform X2 [Dendrobates tinctorius]|uniref:Z-DNA-binding protein 1 isoform X2 n=1 Tax=Dendrobates tinctorius TaxID=92724 RepID=UPI003CC9B30A